MPCWGWWGLFSGAGLWPLCSLGNRNKSFAPADGLVGFCNSLIQS